MIYAIHLNKDEQQLLKSHYSNAQCKLIRERAHSIILSNQGRTVTDIALILMRNETTIRQWLNDFNQRRISSIFHKYEGNTNANKLTIRQKKEIEEILQQPPSEKGLPKKFWDIAALKQYIKGEFGIVYESDRSYHYLLRLGKLSFKLPSSFDIKRDVDQINKRLAEIHQEIKPYLQNDDWEVLVVDEARITWEAEIRRAWLKKNEKTVVKVHRDNQYQNYFGALNIKNQKSHVIKLNWQNQEEIIRALKKILNRYGIKKKICVIWDNARWHKGKELRMELRKGKSLERIHLINFPPYAPDVNPQEKVWNYGKNRLANDTPDSFEKTKQLFENFTRNKLFDYKISEFVLR